MMMLGREIGLPAELMFGSPGNTRQPEGDQYVGELQTAIEGARRVARETLKKGNPISLPSIIILGVYPVLLFTEDLNAPANCGRY
jgi:hypothetical protein